jgi:hypothetical protein
MQKASKMPAINSSPIRYSPAVEKPEKNEGETTDKLIETMRGISEKVADDSGHAERGVHAKSHGVLKGTLTVPADLPPTLRQGLFAKPGQYPVLIRFSTSPGDILDDKVSTPRGMAIKVVGVEGVRMAGSEDDATQDFLMVNGPAFLTPDVKGFLRNVSPLAASTDKAEGAKKAFSAVLRGTEKAVEALGGESSKLKSMGGHPETNLLGETFYSQVPLRFGDYVAKISAAPVSESLLSLKDAPLDLSRNPDGIRAAVIDYFTQQAAEWELRAQLCHDVNEMPIEDASVVWPEDLSPYLAVARIRVEPQQAWSAARVAAVNDTMSFSPWHGLEAHRPLGSIMRARKAVYDIVSKFRASRNGRTLAEPKTLSDLPD